MPSLVSLAANEDWDECLAMLERGEGDVHKGMTGRTPLLAAAYYPDKPSTAALKRLLEKGANVNDGDDNGRTAHHYAANAGFELDIVDELLANGADNDAKDDPRRMTPLHFAADDQRMAVAIRLVEKGADVNATTNGGLTPMYWAAEHGQLGLVDKLLAEGVNVDANAATDGTTALHIAAAQGHVDLVDKLIAKGADINLRNESGTTPLFLALAHNQLAAAELLVDGADVNAKDVDGLTALHMATHLGYLALIDELVAKGAHIEAKSRAWMGDHRNAGNKRGMTPLILAALHNSIASGEHLLEKGANINAKGEGCTPLHHAAGKNQHAAAVRLVEKGANVKAKAQDGLTFLATEIDRAASAEPSRSRAGGRNLRSPQAGVGPQGPPISGAADAAAQARREADKSASLEQAAEHDSHLRQREQERVEEALRTIEALRLAG